MGAGGATMGASAKERPRQWPMRCRKEGQVPKCFRSVKCPYPEASKAYGTYGAINYSLVGPKSGEVVVCFHGLNGSRMLYQELGLYLSQKGFQVLSFDLYGHGLSNAPRVDMCPCGSARSCSRNCSCGAPRARYDLDFFVEQTMELLELLGFEDKAVNLVGFSLGGTIAVAFAQRYPSRVLRLVAMSPAGFLPKVPLSYYLLKATWCCLIPLAPHVLCTYWYKKERFAKNFRSEGQEVEDEVINNLWTRFVWQLYVKRGVASATLAVCERVPWFNLRGLFREAGQNQRPVLLIWGERDALNPPETVAQEVFGCFSNAQLLKIRGAGHISICDKPNQVFSSINTFLHLPPDTRMEHASVNPGDQSMARVSSSGGAAAARAGSQIPEDHRNLLDPCGDSQPGGEANRAAQMPVPMILGHREDLGASSGPSGESRQRSTTECI